MPKAFDELNDAGAFSLDGTGIQLLNDVAIRRMTQSDLKRSLTYTQRIVGADAIEATARMEYLFEKRSGATARTTLWLTAATLLATLVAAAAAVLAIKN